MCESASDTRRSFLIKIKSLFNLSVIGALIYPLLAFLDFKVPRKPTIIKISGTPATGFHINKDFVLFLDKNKHWAVSRKCTHLGCRLNISEIEKLLVCPCHQSKFAYNGDRLEGPAKNNLVKFKVEKVQDGFLVIM